MGKVFTTNRKGANIIGKPSSTYGEEHHSKTKRIEEIERFLIEDYNETIEYCRCGHSDVAHTANYNTFLENEEKGIDTKTKCELCECINFR